MEHIFHSQWYDIVYILASSSTHCFFFFSFLIMTLIIMHLKDYCSMSGVASHASWDFLLLLITVWELTGQAHVVWTGVFLKQHFCFWKKKKKKEKWRRKARIIYGGKRVMKIWQMGGGRQGFKSVLICRPVSRLLIMTDAMANLFNVS